MLDFTQLTQLSNVGREFDASILCLKAHLSSQISFPRPFDEAEEKQNRSGFVCPCCQCALGDFSSRSSAADVLNFHFKDQRVSLLAQEPWNLRQSVRPCRPVLQVIFAANSGKRDTLLSFVIYI